jgi:twitching motility protein PilT
VSQLAKLIEFLDRDDVSEVVIATGRPVTLRMGGEYRALGKAPASLPQLDALFAGTPIAELIASGGVASERVRLRDRDVVVDVQAHGEQVMVRIGRPRPPAPQARPPPAAPAPQPRPVISESGPVVVAAPPAPRPRAREHLMSPVMQAAPRANGAAAPLPVEAAPIPAADTGDFEALLSRAGDGDGGPGVRDAAGRAAAPAMAPVATRHRPIELPQAPSGSSPGIDPLVERSDAALPPPTTAMARRGLDLPPAEPGAEVEVIPTATATPTIRRRGSSAPPPSTSAPAAPRVQPAPAPPVAAQPPLAGPYTPPPPAGPYTPARRHTITVAPIVEPLPPLVTGQTHAAPELLAILAGARARNASDLHLAGDRPPMERSVRGLEPMGAALAPAEVERLLASLLSPAQKAQLDARGYVDAALDVEGAGRLRANVSRFRGGVKGAFRLVAAAPPRLDALGLPRELSRVASYHQGLVVIAGPNGHGKTTTLAALVDLVNARKAHHIITIEDPVEIIHPRKRSLISQREVGHHTRSFASALRASLREDPDVIVIGELRDRETVEIALTAAETGHLVMATMSTPSAAKTLDRLIDMFPPDDQQQVRTSLAAALRFVVAQRLLPGADGASAVAAAELLTGVLPLAALIRDNKLFQVASLQQRGRSFGMIRLDDSLLELVRAGRLSEDVALRAAESRKDLAAALRLPPPPAPGPQGAPAARGRAGGVPGGRRPE